MSTSGLDEGLLDKVLSKDRDKMASNACRAFYNRLGKHGQFQITDTKERFSIIHPHTYDIVAAEACSVLPVSFVHSSLPQSQLCTDLITAALMDMTPLPGVSLCPCETGNSLRLYANIVETTPSERLNCLEKLKKSFFRHMMGDSSNMNTVVVPLNLDQQHWGILVGKRYIGSKRARRDYPTVYFGDSLRWKCPENVITFFKEAFKVIVLGGEGSAELSKRNYMLDVRGYKRQSDSFSCGCYVIACATEFVSNRGFAPSKTYKSGYSAVLSEQYRWMAIRSRVLQIILASQFYNTERVTETMVSRYRLDNREHYYRIRAEGQNRLKNMRHPVLKRSDFKLEKGSGIAEALLTPQTTAYVGGDAKKECVAESNEVMMKDNFESNTSIKDAIEECFSSICGVASTAEKKLDDDDDISPSNCSAGDRGGQLRLSVRARVKLLNAKALPVPTRTSERRVRFVDSSMAVKGVVDGILMDVFQRVGSKDTKEVGKLMDMSTFDLLKPVADRPGTYLEGDVFSIIALLASIAQSKGFLYGLHYFRYVQLRRKGNERLISGRFRCQRHSKYASSCPSNVMVSLPSLNADWKVRFNLHHTHEPTQVSESNIQQRNKSLEKTMQARFRTWKGKEKGKDNTYWELLYRKCFPDHSASAIHVQRNVGEDLFLFPDGVSVQENILAGSCRTTHDNEGRSIQPKPIQIKTLQPTKQAVSIVGPPPQHPFHVLNFQGVHAMGSTHSRSDVERHINSTVGIGSLRIDERTPVPVADVSDVRMGSTGDVTYVDSDVTHVHAELGDNSLISKRESHGSRGSAEGARDRSLQFNSAELRHVDCAFSGGETEAGEATETNTEMEDVGASELIERFLFLDDNEEVSTELVHVLSGEEQPEAVIHSCSELSEERRTAATEEERSDAGSVSSAGVDEFFKAAVIAYFGSLPLNAPGRDVVREVRFIAESMGYNLRCRTSIFLGRKETQRDIGVAGDSRVLQKCILKCKKQEDNDLCPFSLTIKTLTPLKEEEGRSYVGDFREASHNHPPTSGRAGIRHLPPKLRREAAHMTDNLHMSLPDTIRYLEDKHSIVINPKSVRQVLGYGRSISNPKDLECTKLFKALVALKEEDVGNRYYISHDSEGRMTSVCWAFAEWIEDYRSFGVIPGVSIDCKAVANRYGLPLITINGRANDGFTLTFFMGFMSGETEADFVEILTQFKSMIPVSPALICMDQSSACIAATEQVFDHSFIILDEWHLNQNQMKNVTAWCSHIGRVSWCDDMSRDLFNLRRSNALPVFMERRDNFIQKYFTGLTEKLPVWFTYLYVHRPQLLVACFRIAAVPIRYLFQGTGYTEASNSGYRAYILAKKVPFSEIPRQMRLLTQKRREARNEARIRALSPMSSRYRSIRNFRFPIPPGILDGLISEYTSYALTKFQEIGVIPAGNYAVRRAYVAKREQVYWPELAVEEGLRIGLVACFELTWSFQLLRKLEVPRPKPPTAPLRVLFARKEIENDDGGESQLLVRCDCQKTDSIGFPCRHIVRCAIVYNEYVLSTPRLKEVLDEYIELESFFHSYWKNSPETLSFDEVCRRRSLCGVLDMESLTTKLESSHESIEATALHTFLKRESPNEVRKLVKWSDNKALFDQLHKLADGIGPSAVESVGELLREAHKRVIKGEIATKTVLEQVNTTGHCEKEGGERVQWLDSTLPESIPLLKAPNVSRVKFKKRKKSFTEKFNSKKGKAENQQRAREKTACHIDPVERLSQDSVGTSEKSQHGDHL